MDVTRAQVSKDSHAGYAESAVAWQKVSLQIINFLFTEYTGCG